MTEEESKTKWCPFARQTDRGFGSFNRVRYPVTNENGVIQKTKEGWNIMSEAQPSGGCYCIGSKCMAWRESLSCYSRDKGRFLEAGEPLDSSCVMKKLPDSRGYCGLAGVP